MHLRRYLRPYEEYTFLISINSAVHLAMSVRLSVYLYITIIGTIREDTNLQEYKTFGMP